MSGKPRGAPCGTASCPVRPVRDLGRGSLASNIFRGSTLGDDPVVYNPGGFDFGTGTNTNPAVVPVVAAPTVPTPSAPDSGGVAALLRFFAPRAPLAVQPSSGISTTTLIIGGVAVLGVIALIATRK